MVSFLAATERTEVIDLRYIAPEDLQPILDEEAVAWERLLHWDFGVSAELVLRFVGLRNLNGYALVVNGEIAGYSYYISEAYKGLIGDLYVAQRFRNTERENRLLETTLLALIEVETVHRVEAQLMMVDNPLYRQLPFPEKVERFRRAFFIRPRGAVPLREGPGANRILLESWRDERHDDAARVICSAYEGHIDSHINDQYQSLVGARSFLLNIIQYPGCGRFYQPGSFLAFDRETGLPCGLILTSMVNQTVGHITQICVLPQVRQYGIGFELLRRALTALEENGCTEVSLTVTSANESAIRLYERLGFQQRCEFAANVWDGLGFGT